MVTEDTITKDMVTEDMVTEDMVTKDMVTEYMVTEDMVTKDMVTNDMVSEIKLSAATVITDNNLSANMLPENKISVDDDMRQIDNSVSKLPIEENMIIESTKTYKLSGVTVTKNVIANNCDQMASAENQVKMNNNCLPISVNNIRTTKDLVTESRNENNNNEEDANSEDRFEEMERKIIAAIDEDLAKLDRGEPTIMKTLGDKPKKMKKINIKSNINQPKNKLPVSNRILSIEKKREKTTTDEETKCNDNDHLWFNLNVIDSGAYCNKGFRLHNIACAQCDIKFVNVPGDNKTTLKPSQRNSVRCCHNDTCEYALCKKCYLLQVKK
jgi:hypothetical protein